MEPNDLENEYLGDVPGGTVREILVAVGDRVARGQSLIRVEWDPVLGQDQAPNPTSGFATDRSVAAPTQEVGDPTV